MMHKGVCRGCATVVSNSSVSTAYVLAGFTFRPCASAPPKQVVPNVGQLGHRTTFTDVCTVDGMVAIKYDIKTGGC